MISSRAQARAAGIAVGFVADRCIKDPARWHPVAGMGRVVGRIERAMYADDRAIGVAFTGVCVASTWWVSRKLQSSNPWFYAAATAATTWVSVGGMQLADVAGRVGAYVAADDLESARELIPSLCGRDPSMLDADGAVRAALESLAENTSDATVGPLIWAGVAGPAGVLTYRMINTLDSMVGYRSPRYRQFGWASARLDDIVNLIPARLCALLAAGCGPYRSGALAAWRADAHKHPSPNAGPVEASFAGALGITLGGTTVYAHGTEQRPHLGSGPTPDADDVARAVVLSQRVQGLSAIVAVLLALWLP